MKFNVKSVGINTENQCWVNKNLTQEQITFASKHNWEDSYDGVLVKKRKYPKKPTQDDKSKPCDKPLNSSCVLKKGVVCIPNVLRTQRKEKGFRSKSTQCFAERQKHLAAAEQHLLAEVL